VTRAFVTGAGGYLGRALVERLVSGGYEVVALTRTETGAGALSKLGVRTVSGDVLDSGSLEAGMRGCDLAFNVAGRNAMCLRDPRPMLRVNVEGPRNVVTAAARTGVGRVVHTSSGAAIGERPGTVATESTRHRGWYLSAYERSKVEGERAAFDSGAKHGLEVVCVNPSSVQGPPRASGSARLLIAFANGRLRTVIETHLSIVDVVDCAEGHVLAAERGRAGERYLLNGATLELPDAIELVARVTGASYRVVTLPPAVARAAGIVGGLVGAVRRRDPGVCPELVRVLLHGHRYDGSRAERELGLRYTPVEETARRTLLWYARQGIITRPMPGLSAGSAHPAAG
jgi:dihydroflavonol-4-reductase